MPPLLVNTIGAVQDEAAMQTSGDPFLQTVRWNRAGSILKCARAVCTMMD